MSATQTRPRVTEISPAAANAAIREAEAIARREQQRLQLVAAGQLWTPRRRNGLKFVDIFCGAGGSSIGLSNAGYELLLAANHWRTAIDSHAANFTNSEHLCADVNNYDFRYLPRGADVLWASPICTELSPAGGSGGPSNAAFDAVEQLGHVDQGGRTRTRATFWDVVRATEVWRFKAIMVENVPDAADRWVLFDVWLSAMERLGYTYQLVSVNSAHIGGGGIPYAPQWRDRMYVVFIRKDIGRTPDVEPRPIARCFTCEQDVNGVQTWLPKMQGRKHKVGRYRRNPNSSYGQYWYSCPNKGCGNRVEPYVAPAASIIDWSDLGTRIGDLPRTKQKPEGLAPKTMARIRAGIEKFGWQALTAAVAGNTHERAGALRAWPAASNPVPTLQTTATLGTVMPPFYVKNNTNPNPATMTHAATGEPFGTITTQDTTGLVNPPFRVALNHGPDAAPRLHALGDEPLSAATTKQGDAVVFPPMGVPVGGTWADDPINLLDGPARTVLANEKGCEALVTPHPGAFIDVQRNHMEAQHIDEPIPTVTTARHSALVIPYYSNGTASTTGEPFGTVSTHDRYAMVNPGDLKALAEFDAMDALYRMLKPRESLRAQAFSDDYIVLGGSGEQTMQAGNAVSANVAEWLAERVADVLLPHPGF
ncbi:DNA cytosine methyltransferase [Actinoplanes sp. URMC 104]|uniref:DNA cytosine methyltransferase n=1 Tax=Actinoplanes sp. URMC 104 TaxID=3423409 RepID=UPI003F1AE8BA